MANRGYLQIGSRRWEFATVKLPQHRTRWPVMVTDSLNSTGLDGELVINLHRRFQPFTVNFTVSYSTIASAAQYLEDLKGSQGYFGELRIDLFNDSRIWKKCQLMGARGRAMPDVGGGPYALSNQTAMIRASAIIRPTQLPAGL